MILSCICNVMHHCMSMSCHICNECHMDNINHTLCHVSWTIIVYAYNFENKHSFQCQYIHTHINIHQTKIIKHVIINQVITPLTFKANYGIYNTHTKKANTSIPKPVLKLAIKPTKQALNSLNYYYFYPNSP